MEFATSSSVLNLARCAAGKPMKIVSNQTRNRMESWDLTIQTCCSVEDLLNSICLRNSDTRQYGVAVVYPSDNEWMDECSCSIVTEGLAYCSYLAQLVKTRTNHASNVQIHLQFFVDEYTQVNWNGRPPLEIAVAVPAGCLSIFAS